MHDIENICHHLRKALDCKVTVKKANTTVQIAWRGPEITNPIITCVSKAVRQQLSEDGIRCHDEQGRDILDIILMLAFQFGVENGLEIQQERIDDLRLALNLRDR